MALSKALRYEVLRRDEFACRYCGAKAPDVSLTVDHVIPAALGGSDEPNNLVAACSDCNGGKGSTHPDAATVADVDARALLWAKARERVAEEMEVALRDRLDMEEVFEANWEQARPNQFYGCDLPPDFGSSLEQWTKRGVPFSVIQDLASVALSKRGVSQKWRHFCGCVWTRIRQMDEDTAALAEQMEVGSGA